MGARGGGNLAAARGQRDVHDVKVVSAPKGARRFWSDPGSIDDGYRQTLRVPGTYKLLCTFHEADGMRMTITVRRPPTR